MDIVILIGSFTVVCLMGMPVAYALGIASILGALYTGIPLEAVMLKVAGGMSGFSLLAIPFFILTGAIMAIGGMAERLINLAKVFVGAIRGGMALVNILASTMFGCISGSSVADTAAVGGVMIPQMIKMGYPRLFAVNVTISGSLQPLLVPPSHNMIIYSIAAGGTVSVAHLFMGGIIPALLLGLSLVILVLYIAHRDNFPKGEQIKFNQIGKIVLDAVWGMVTIVIILGGILSGVFTPTESGAVACVYAFLVTMFVYRDVKWSEIPKLIGRVIRTVGMVMIMIGFSISFGYMMALMQMPAPAAATTSSGRVGCVHTWCTSQLISSVGCQLAPRSVERGMPPTCTLARMVVPSQVAAMERTPSGGPMTRPSMTAVPAYQRSRPAVRANPGRGARVPSHRRTGGQSWLLAASAASARMSSAAKLASWPSLNFTLKLPATGCDTAAMPSAGSKSQGSWRRCWVRRSMLTASRQRSRSHSG